MNEQNEPLQNFLPLLRPIESLIFAPFFLGGVMKELPSESMLRAIERKPFEEPEEKRAEKVVPMRIRSEKSRERKAIYGMWGGGF